jgi:cytochrome c biogenesis protein CcdA
METMDNYILAAASAFWLGVLTSISPCPLATNIAAISFIGRRVGNPRRVFITGLLYTGGRTITYLVLGMVIVASLLSSSELSLLLQKYMNKLLGPILILVGMFLLELIQLRSSGGGMSERFQQRAESFGMWGAGLLGIVFALSLCPLSAALFFGSLIPLSVQHNSSITMPALYGIGTGLPVLVFAVIIAFGAKSLGKAYDILTKIEKWARKITGTIFILVGIYYCLVYIFRVL